VGTRTHGHPRFGSFFQDKTQKKDEEYFCDMSSNPKNIIRTAKKSLEQGHMSNPTAAPPLPPLAAARFRRRAAPPQIAGKRPIAIILAAKRPKHSPFIAQKSVRVLAAGSGKVVGPPRPGEPPPRCALTSCHASRSAPRDFARFNAPVNPY